MKIIKETIGTLFNNRKSLYIFPCGIFLINILLLPCFGIETGYAEPVFSITTINEPLYNLLAKISKSTGYKIEMKKGLKNKSLTANLNKFTLEEGIRAIFRIIEEPNYAIVIDDSMKKVEIRVFNASSDNSSIRTNSPAEHQQRQKERTVIDAGVTPDFIDNEVMPPETEVAMPPEPQITIPRNPEIKIRPKVRRHGHTHGRE
jgi:hypothetical protein